jgi:uncharacterized oligopeptide transporter (OPT) family protein
MEEPQTRFAKTLTPHLTRLKWGAACCGIFGSLILALNIPISGWAFVVFLGSSALWMAAATLMKERAILAEASVYTIINCLGIWRWLF